MKTGPFYTVSKMSSSQGETILKLVITHDSVCHWCYIGWKEMLCAIQMTEDAGLPVKFNIEFRPFRLDTALPPDEPVERDVRLLEKWGSERYANVRSVINKRGEEVDIKFTWRGPVRRTGDCHRLLRYAYSKSSIRSSSSSNTIQAQLATEIYKAFFELGEDIGDHENLAKYALNVGLFDTKEKALEFLASDAYWDEVEELIEECQAQGITGVPHTVVNDRWAIIGGQMSDTYYKIFEKLARMPVRQDVEPVMD